MIYDSLENLSRYIAFAPEAVGRLADELSALSYETPAGKKTLIVGKLFIMVQCYNTRKNDLEQLESHEEFADLQLVVSGDETGYCGAVENLECVREMTDDYALFRANADAAQSIALSQGKFAVFFPGEGHMAGFGDGSPVVKAVVKIHRSLLK